ncbi:MAG: hypothetical protein JWO68_4050 [Actinomycetia bacterium]|nr:hypothetical protein [Actinomycetes bacterium]
MNKDLIVLFAVGGLWSAQASAQGAPVSNAPDATAAPSTVAFVPPESFAFKLNRYGDHSVGLTAQSRIAFSRVKVNAGNITAKVAGESGGSCIYTGQTFTGTIDAETRTIKGSAPGARGPRCQLDVILTFTADGKLVSGTPVTAGDRGRATVDAGKTLTAVHGIIVAGSANRGTTSDGSSFSVCRSLVLSESLAAA